MLKEDTKEFLSMLEGYHQESKCLHWSATHMSEHKLIDDIDHSILDYEDEFAELAMGITDSRFGNGDLKTLLPSAKNLKDMLSELLDDVESYKEKCKDYAGIVNKLDDFITDINKWDYLRTFA